MSPAHPSPTTGLPTRARLAVATGRAVAGASKLVHFGSGSVIGGRAALLVDGDLLRQLTRDREVVIVSATNGKTTTTRLIGAALGTDRPVVSNSLGANMTPGIVAALGVADPAATAVLEVDERWVEDVLAATGAGTVVLLNLSRDQLDRTQEVRKLAERWRRALTATPPARVVANADDPLVTWAASAAPEVIWVATGQDWNSDAAGCPNCSGRIAFEPGAWRCTGCDLARPTPDVTIDEMTMEGRRGAPRRAGAARPRPARPGEPGQRRLRPGRRHGAGRRPHAGGGRRRCGERGRRPVPGRLARRAARCGCCWPRTRPGGTRPSTSSRPRPAPVVVAINARIADGHDPSWLWDVAYERLAGRLVVATGERRHDLAVRLRYAGVEHVTVAEVTEAVRRAAAAPGHEPGAVVDVAANYTAFQEYLDLVGGPR